MRSMIVFSFLCLSSLLFSNGNMKRAYIITGPEGSGSCFITQVVAHVVGKDPIYVDVFSSKRDDFYGKIGDDIVVHHRSQPSGTPYYPLEYFRKTFEGYKLYFIITTRDKNISRRSIMSRFGRSAEEVDSQEIMSKKILSEILRKENCFIWNYETQIYLKEAYFEKLYKFMGIKSNFIPPDLRDGNRGHVKQDIPNPHGGK